MAEPSTPVFSAFEPANPNLVGLGYFLEIQIQYESYRSREEDEGEGGDGRLHVNLTLYSRVFFCLMDFKENWAAGLLCTPSYGDFVVRDEHKPNTLKSRDLNLGSSQTLEQIEPVDSMN